MTPGPVPTEPPPVDAWTVAALLATLDRAVLAALHHTDTVRDEPGGVLYLHCTWTAGRVRRIVIARRPDGRYSMADQLVQPWPWQVRVVAERDAVQPLYVNAKLREFARAAPPPVPVERVPQPRKAPVAHVIHPTPDTPPHPVRVITQSEIAELGPLTLNSDGSTTLAVRLNTGETVPVHGQWTPTIPSFTVANGLTAQETPDA